MTALDGATVVVTGGSSGIGLVTARALHAAGSRVEVVAREPSRLAAVATELGATSWAVDLADPEQRQQWCDHLRGNPPDVLVQCAGVGLVQASADDGTRERAAVAHLLDVNVRAAMESTAAVLPAMCERGAGHLVFVGSIAGALGVGGESAYSASKAALMAYAAGLASEVRARGIRVTTVVPGVVATPFFQRRGSPYARRFPRPVPASLVAERLVDAVRNDRRQVVVPRWLRVPILLSDLAPGWYGRLASRWG